MNDSSSLPPPRGEFAVIDRLRSRLGSHPRIRLGIGDDAAWLDWNHPDGLLMASDMMLDGRHFRLAECGPRAVGHKALAINLSDMAAMAARPVAATVSVALPLENASEIAEELFLGLTSLADRYDVHLVGGDTTAWDGPLVIDVSILGEPVGDRVISRRGARVDDLIFVTGPLGGSITGRHLTFEPRIREALALHRSVRLHAMIDLSDGLGSDLVHILRASGGLGAILEAASIPIHPDVASAVQRDGRSHLEHALFDGEDFELCFTVSPDQVERFPSNTPIYPLGRITESGGLRLRTQSGELEQMTDQGFNHL